MLGVSKPDNVTVHGDQMSPRSCRRTRRKQNVVHPFPSRGRQAQSCRRQFLQATPASDRPCDGIWHYSHVVIVSDSQPFLSTHSHGQATGLHNDVRELRRHDVRLSESIQLVLIFVEIQVDGKITTGIEGLRKNRDIRANQRRPRRVDETANTVHGCTKGVRIRHVTNKDAFRSIAGSLS